MHRKELPNRPGAGHSPSSSRLSSHSPSSNQLPTKGGEDPDVRFLAENSDLSPRQARELIREHGHDRDELLRIARTMKAEG
ncbi:hypothetical protein [Mesorhizobium sp. WSM4904]|uniref:hypothetical protein n=2 Tax=unclassified Mesorhizobium TaxID=325217 RepID=UPI0024185CB0|nr:hypothetical protein [Mesorhizobium sp. WSM4904]WFP66229.1 hypothetical protein QAZ47_23965 [Mesorhizobium sp. WSM4904]